MTILAELAAKAGEELLTAEAVTRGIAAAEDAASEHLDGDMANAAIEAIARLRPVAGSIARQGTGVLASVMIAHATGSEDQRKRVRMILAQGGGLERLLAHERVLAAAALGAIDQRTKDAEEIWQAIGSAALIGVRLALPFILAAL